MDLDMIQITVLKPWTVIFFSTFILAAQFEILVILKNCELSFQPIEFEMTKRITKQFKSRITFATPQITYIDKPNSLGLALRASLTPSIQWPTNIS